MVALLRAGTNGNIRPVVCIIAPLALFVKGANVVGDHLSNLSTFRGVKVIVGSVEQGALGIRSEDDG